MATITVTHGDIFTEVRKYLIALFSCDVMQGYQNDVPVPESGIVMHVLFERDIDYTANYYHHEASAITAQRSVELSMQLDFYGEEADSRARVVANLWQSSYTTARLEKCQPLYSEAPRKMVLVNEANQYENRVMLEVKLQYNPEITYSVDNTDSFSLDLNSI
ncbi:phage neck terminator protein [Xenorhabdus bharatensis]|uniref:phage neck terminator protein n=1 Tax=Xenorhabdus bharatensis TaxID=3136256 RepID=UPI0030F3F5F6